MTPEYLLSEDFKNLQAGVEKLQDAWNGRQEVHLSSLSAVAKEIAEVTQAATSDGLEKALPSILECAKQLNSVCETFAADKDRIVEALRDVSEQHYVSVCSR